MSAYAAFMFVSAFVIFMAGLSVEYEKSNFPGDSPTIPRQDYGAYRKEVSRAIKGLGLAPLLSGGISLFGKSRKIDVLSLLALILGVITAAVALRHIDRKYRKRGNEHENSNH